MTNADDDLDKFSRDFEAEVRQMEEARKKSYENTKFGETIFWFIIVGIFIFCLAAYKDEQGCLQHKYISTVGGCDFSGDCGVMFVDGSTGTANHPIPGQSVCVMTHWQSRFQK